ncbi:MAG: NAD-dependent epimerase/dehydratase family protein [Pseudomonadota bacterium]
MPDFTVLGAGGFIGSALAQSLRAHGHSVYTPRRAEPAIFEADLGHVIYCIGMTADFRSRPFETVDAHVGVLAEVLRRAHFESLLYLSSTRVYGNASHGGEQSLLQVDPADPSDLYNLTKLTGESLCRSGKPGVKVARLSNVVGSDPESANFLPSLIREALAGRIELQSDPESAKDYILLDDVVALLPAIAVGGKHWLYNVASGRSLRHAELVARLAALTGCEVAVRAAAPRFDFPVIDTARIRSEFGFSAGSVIDHLDRLVEQARQRHASPPPDFLDHAHGPSRTI